MTSKKQIGTADKVKALKRHLLEGVTVSQVCEECGITPNAFYAWQHKLFEHAEVVLQTSKKPDGASNREQEQIRLLQERLRQREEALAELMAEHVALKKSSIGLA